MSGLFQLIANGGVWGDRYLLSDFGGICRRFNSGVIVSWEQYLRYIEEELLSELSEKVFGRRKTRMEFATELWIRENCQTRLLLRKKFWLETGVNWRQFDDAVFKHLNFRHKPRSWFLLNWGMNFSDVPEASLRNFFIQHHAKISKQSVRDCLIREPVVNFRKRHKLEGNILQFYAGLDYRKVQLMGRPYSSGGFAGFTKSTAAARPSNDERKLEFRKKEIGQKQQRIHNQKQLKIWLKQSATPKRRPQQQHSQTGKRQRGKQHH